MQSHLLPSNTKHNTNLVTRCGQVVQDEKMVTDITELREDID